MDNMTDEQLIDQVRQGHSEPINHSHNMLPIINRQGSANGSQGFYRSSSRELDIFT
ncbi:hypothetical protein SAMN04487897_13735 [Paenibacillus sp. yr247]|uniref:hypothetical protein n=1 Tax=Paenibacillus sp. yr247 TaxID=1761880 RepID=UPI000887CD17|nr:hypothetical protein [Paenibacillus sp. yr247]SDP11756.1 hypothetical protein SAMN04487897_13735 [Paenibacillus sp. yr247]